MNFPKLVTQLSAEWVRNGQLGSQVFFVDGADGKGQAVGRLDKAGGSTNCSTMWAVQQAGRITSAEIWGARGRPGGATPS